MSSIKVAIIGGSGFYTMESLTDTEEVTVQTPFGDPSAPLLTGNIQGLNICVCQLLCQASPSWLAPPLGIWHLASGLALASSDVKAKLEYHFKNCFKKWKSSFNVYVYQRENAIALWKLCRSQKQNCVARDLISYHSIWPSKVNSKSTLWKCVAFWNKQNFQKKYFLESLLWDELFWVKAEKVLLKSWLNIALLCLNSLQAFLN